MSILPTNVLNQLGYRSIKSAFYPLCTNSFCFNFILYDCVQYAPLYIELCCLNCSKM